MRNVTMLLLAMLFFVGLSLIGSQTRAVPDRKACLEAQQECSKNCKNKGGSELDKQKEITCLKECTKRYNECIKG
jgi:uncharacterized membrane protein